MASKKTSQVRRDLGVLPSSRAARWKNGSRPQKSRLGRFLNFPPKKLLGSAWKSLGYPPPDAAPTRPTFGELACPDTVTPLLTQRAQNQRFQQSQRAFCRVRD